MTLLIFFRGCGYRLDIINLPNDSIICDIKGKWALLARKSQEEQYTQEYNYDMCNCIVNHALYVINIKR
jgi:hypothetical protein